MINTTLDKMSTENQPIKVPLPNHLVPYVIEEDGQRWINANLDGTGFSSYSVTTDGHYVLSPGTPQFEHKLDELGVPYTVSYVDDNTGEVVDELTLPLPTREDVMNLPGDLRPMILQEGSKTYLHRHDPRFGWQKFEMRGEDHYAVPTDSPAFEAVLADAGMSAQKVYNIDDILEG